MPSIVSVHSFRGGTGKSNTTANLAALIAQQGLRVGVIDTDIASPGIHVLFGLEDRNIQHSLNDYLWGRCNISQTAHDVTANLGISNQGKVFLIPSSLKAGEIAKVLREGYDVGLLHDGFNDLIDALHLDFLMIDTHPGVNEETLLSIAISDMLLIILRPDQQDFQGTAVTVEVARKLEVANMLLLVNKVPTVFNFGEVKANVERTYNTAVAAVLPHSDEMMILGSKGVFAVRYPEHAISQSLRQVAAQLINN